MEMNAPRWLSVTRHNRRFIFISFIFFSSFSSFRRGLVIHFNHAESFWPTNVIRYYSLFNTERGYGTGVCVYRTP